MARGQSEREQTRVASPVAEPVSNEPAVLSPKARSTRANLVAAATEVFSERMYLNTNVAEIVARAGVSHGTFYTYFTSKEDIFREVGLCLLHRMLEARATFDEDVPLFDRIEATNRRYLELYRENAALFAVIEQGATFNDELREIRREIRNGYVLRSEEAIAKSQRAGLVARDVDARYAANALGSMVERFAYVWLVLGEEFEFDEAVRSLTLLWARSLGIEVPARRRSRARRTT